MNEKENTNKEKEKEEKIERESEIMTEKVIEIKVTSHKVRKLNSVISKYVQVFFLLSIDKTTSHAHIC